MRKISVNVQVYVALKRAVGLRFLQAKEHLFLVAGSLLGQQDSLDVGQNSSLGDGDSGQELVQLLVVTDGQLQMAGVDSGLLVVTGGVTSQLENLSSEVLKHGGKVDRRSGSHTLGVVALAEETVKTSNGELQTGTAGSALGLSSGLGFASLSTA